MDPYDKLFEAKYGKLFEAKLEFLRSGLERVEQGIASKKIGLGCSEQSK